MKYLEAGRRIPRKTITYYLIGDDGVSKSFFFNMMDIEEEESAQEMNVYVQPIDSNTSIEIYDFPTDKIVRAALPLYLGIIEPPTLILYFLSSDLRSKDIPEWIRLITQRQPQAKVLFLSDANTYAEREKLLNRVGKEFEVNIVEHICFVNLEPHALPRALQNMETVGVEMSRANCLKPSFSQRIMQKWRNYLSRCRRSRNLPDAQSVI